MQSTARRLCITCAAKTKVTLDITAKRLYTSGTTNNKVTLDNIFSEANKQAVQENLDKVQSIRNIETIHLKRKFKLSAVLIPLCMVNGEPSILFTLRSTSLRNHRGEVSFPGGYKEEGDTSLINTALRETFEELGIAQERFAVWGQMRPTPGRDGKSFTHPVIAKMGELDWSSLRLNTDEVEEVFTCRIQDLCDNDKIRTTQFRTGPGYTLPVYLGGKHRIWGLTGIFVHQTLTLLAPGLYTFKIQHVV